MAHVQDFEKAKFYVQNVLTWENRNTRESKQEGEKFIYLLDKYVYREMFLKDNLWVYCKVHLLQNKNLFPYHEYFNNFLNYYEFWYNDLNFRWVLYALMKDLLETANIEVYHTLLNMFQALNEEKIRGSHPQIITKDCFVEYPPIADFFDACSGKPVYGDYNLKRQFNLIQHTVYIDDMSKALMRAEIQENLKYITDEYKFALISTDLPELIQEYLTFDIREEIRILNKFGMNFPTDVYSEILRMLGYEVKTKRTTKAGASKVELVIEYPPEELKKIIFTEFYTNKIHDYDEHVLVRPTSFNQQLREFLNSKSKKLCLILVPNLDYEEETKRVEVDEYKEIIYRKLNDICVVENPKLEGSFKEFVTYDSDKYENKTLEQYVKYGRRLRDFAYKNGK